MVNCAQLTYKDLGIIKSKLSDQVGIVIKKAQSEEPRTRNVSRGKNGYKLCENFLGRAAAQVPAPPQSIRSVKI